MVDILKKICNKKKEELEHTKNKYSLKTLQKLLPNKVRDIIKIVIIEIISQIKIIGGSGIPNVVPPKDEIFLIH